MRAIVEGRRLGREKRRGRVYGDIRSGQLLARSGDSRGEIRLESTWGRSQQRDGVRGVTQKLSHSRGDMGKQKKGLSGEGGVKSRQNQRNHKGGRIERESLNQKSYLGKNYH